MDNDFTATLIPMSVILVGFEIICGHPLTTLVSTFLTQNGF